ncbi:BUD13 homolog [Scyliorhinus torazame]|uniref:BUD13 homolog n=1 Tax=Scyliorhinus torazame TaxID=75743 RepID=UPI003B5AEC35
MAALSKEEYLKRYLSGSEREAERPAARRRRKKVKIKAGGMRIVDDDVTWKSLTKEKETVLVAAESDEDEETPVVAEFIDERPEIIQQMEEFRFSNKWKILGDDKEDSQESGQFIQTRSDGLIPGSESAQRKKVEGHPLLPERKIRTVSPDLSPARRGRHDSPDLSPARRGRHDSPDLSPARRGRHDSPDLSPARKGRHDSPDLSPARKGRHDSPDLSPARKGRHDSPDLSPPRKGRCDSPDLSPPRKGRRDSPDLSPPRRGHRDSPDLSPPKRGHRNSPDLSPPRRGRRNSPDLSPPRRGRRDSPDLSPPRRGRRNSPDLSPPRRGRRNSPNLSPPRRGRRDSHDRSPPRKKLAKNTEKCVRSTDIPSRRYHSPDLSQRRQDPDSDLSPPQRCQHSPDSDLSPAWRKKSEAHDSVHKPGSGSSESSPTRQRLPSRRTPLSRGKGASQDSSPNRKSQGKEMLSGGQAGLISTEILRKEKEDRRQKEKAAERVADDSRNATTIFRDKSGKKRDLDQERIEHKKKEEEKAAKQEKYSQWGKGVAQEEQQRKNVMEALHEMQKPLARHIDDEDLDRFLREKERDGDPMAGLIRKKKEKEAKNKNERPVYSGPAPPPNRFNLYPGYRWDGVDRSNGFEQKRYARQADKKAVQEIAYKWSVEDM